MSFILDALRKSEHARQKTTGPTLAEIPVQPSRPRTNLWLPALITLLVVNLSAVGVLLLKRAKAPDEPATNEAASTAAPSAGAAQVPPSAAGPYASVAPGTTLPASSAPVTSVREAPPRPVEPARNPLAEEVVDGPAPDVDTELADRASAVPAGPPAVTRQVAPRRPGTVTYAPTPEAVNAAVAAEPVPASGAPTMPPAAPSSNASRAAPAGNEAAALPGADELLGRGVPDLHLDLHVYSNRPEQRFVFVNSRKYREGDALQEGPVVERITPDGAILAYQGARYRLSHD